MTVDTPITDGEKQAFCAHFERTGELAWRTESGAVVPAERWSDEADDFVAGVVHVPPSDIEDGAASDLFYTLEASCPHREPVG